MTSYQIVDTLVPFILLITPFALLGYVGMLLGKNPAFRRQARTVASRGPSVPLRWLAALVIIGGATLMAPGTPAVIIFWCVGGIALLDTLVCFKYSPMNQVT